MWVSQSLAEYRAEPRCIQRQRYLEGSLGSVDRNALEYQNIRTVIFLGFI
jgi:hypothetical protein